MGPAAELVAVTLDGDRPDTLAVLLAIRYAAFIPFGLYRGVWRYAGARDAASIVGAVILVGMAMGSHNPWQVPSVVIYCTSLILVYLSSTLYHGVVHPPTKSVLQVCDHCSIYLLIAGTYRDVEVDRTHPLSAAVAELRRAGSFLRVPLRGLTVDEVHRMYEAVRGQSVQWAQAELVHRQTEGNPLFVQEVLRYLVEEGLIRHEAGQWQRTGPAPLEMSIPEGLRDVIGKRLSRLSAECNRVLSLAAVVGREQLRRKLVRRKL